MQLSFLWQDDAPPDYLGMVQDLVSENHLAFCVGAMTFASIAAVTYILSVSPKPIKPAVDIDNQSVMIDGKPYHRASRLAKAPDYFAFDRTFPNIQTTYQVLEHGKALSNNGPCLGERTGPNKKYKWLSYQEVIDRVHQFGSGLICKGLTAANDTFVGIYASNRPEWTISDFGCQAYSMCSVPLYDTLGIDGCKYILNQCEIHTVVVDTEEKLQNLIELKPEIPTLKLIVVVGHLKLDLKAAALKLGMEVLRFQDLLDIGKRNLKKPVPPKPTDLFSIVYTSGTTGNPKGAMLTHHAVSTMVDSVVTHSKKHISFKCDDVHLSYLPLAHVFDRTVCIMMLTAGARIGYFSRDITALLDDLAALRPTIFPSVPRLFNRIYDSVMVEVKQSKIKTALLKWALESKTKEVNRMIIRRNSFWDKLLFRKIQNKLGGRVRLAISGSAPLSPDVMQFLKCALGCPVLEGYGQTEAVAGVNLNIVGDPSVGMFEVLQNVVGKPSVGSVGPPVPGCHIKLADIPEINYYARDNIGEVCAKGATLLQGYYKQPDRTAEAIDKDGWLHTGDVGIWLPNGTLKIVDRIKHIFKLSQGEYVAPEKIENVYRASPYIAQCFVDGNSLKSCIMAIVVPDALYLMKWAPSHGFPADVETFCRRKDCHDLVLNDMLEYGKHAGLKGFEQVGTDSQASSQILILGIFQQLRIAQNEFKDISHYILLNLNCIETHKVRDIILEPKLFSVESDLLTPTLKNKRPALRSFFKDKINSLYEKHGL